MLNDAIAIIGCRQVICAISVCCVPHLNVLDDRFKNDAAHFSEQAKIARQNSLQNSSK